MGHQVPEKTSYISLDCEKNVLNNTQIWGRRNVQECLISAGEKKLWYIRAGLV